MSKRQPVRGQVVKWCVCGDWFASERDEREHAGRCPGPTWRDIERQIAVAPFDEVDFGLSRQPSSANEDRS